MSKLKLTLACWDYDRTRPLMDGRVQPERIELNWVCLPPEETFRRQARDGEFDVSEFSLSYHIFLCARGNWPYQAIPVFPSRTFRHSSIYINTDAGIESPSDLVGHKVGVPGYPMTAAVWIRGLLQHEYGVHPEQMTWFYSREDIFPWQPPAGLSLQRIAAGQTIDGMLETGEIAALFTARQPACFAKGSPNVARLFHDFRPVEESYFQRTGLFPIMHTLVIREEILQEHPWVAGSLYQAFLQAKQLCYDDLKQADALKHSLPWLLDDLARVQRVMGEDFWPYGVEANRRVVETLVQYSCEQGLARRSPALSELFADVEASPVSAASSWAGGLA